MFQWLPVPGFKVPTMINVATIWPHIRWFFASSELPQNSLWHKITPGTAGKPGIHSNLPPHTPGMKCSFESFSPVVCVRQCSHSCCDTGWSGSIT